MRNRKAQGGMEGLIALGIIFMIFIGVYMISNSKNSDLINVNKEIVEREDCFKIANLITSIYNLGESSELTTHIYHNLTIEPLGQRISTKNTFCTLILSQVSNDDSYSTSPFTLIPGDVKVSNNNGRIIIENV